MKTARNLIAGQPDLPDVPVVKHRWNEGGPLKTIRNLLLTALSFVLVIVIIVLVWTGVIFHESIETLLSIFVAAAMPFLLLALAVNDYIRKKKRIKYLERILQDHNIEFSYDH